MKNRIAVLSLTLALSVGLCAPAQAADSQTVQATLNAGITVTMDGTPQTFHDAQGAVVLPVTYNGTTYLPVRAVSALVGLGVEWEAETQTVKLTTPEDPTPTTSPNHGTGDGLTSQTVPALLNGAITVTLDGAAQTFHDAQGALVLPLTYNGTTYLPVRAVCGLVGLPVEWVQETSTVKLGRAIPEGALVLNSSNTSLHDGEFLDDGTIKLECDGILGTGGYIEFTNTGYSTLTFTVTVNTWLHKVNVGGIDSVEGDLRLLEKINPGEVKTYTVDISGIKSASMRIFSGRKCDAVVSNIYLLP